MESLKLIVKQNILNIKQVIINKMNIAFLSVIIVICLLIPIIFIPITMAYPLVFIICLIPVNGSVFSTTNFNLKRSTLNKNYNTTKSNRWIFNISTIITMLIFSIIIFNFLYIMILILNNSGILLVEWRQYPDLNNSDGYSFDNFADIGIYLMSLYSIIIISVLTFSISFFISHFISSQKNYFMFILTLLILAIIFGGGLNDYFTTPADVGIAFQQSPMFPREIYWVTLIFPYGPSGQLLRNISRLSEGTCRPDGFQNWHDSYLELMGQIRILSFKNTSIWNLTLVMPYIHIILFGSLGIILSKRK